MLKIGEFFGEKTVSYIQNMFFVFESTKQIFKGMLGDVRVFKEILVVVCMQI